jgi:hypothetical protein
LSQTEIAAAPELIGWFCQWLYCPRENGEPRVLLLSFFGHIYGKLLIGQIKKVFFYFVCQMGERIFCLTKMTFGPKLGSLI